MWSRITGSSIALTGNQPQDTWRACCQQRVRESIREAEGWVVVLDHPNSAMRQAAFVKSCIHDDWEIWQRTGEPQGHLDVVCLIRK